MLHFRNSARLLLAFAAMFMCSGVGWADYQFDDLMGPSGISYQWMVLNDNGDTFGGSHSLAADVSGDVLSNNDAVLNVLSGTSQTAITDRSLNTFFLVVAEGQGGFTMNFRVPSLAQQFDVATPNLAMSTPWDTDATLRELYVDTKQGLGQPDGYDALWRAYNFQIYRANGNASPYNTMAQYFYFQQNPAYAPSQGIPRPFIIANVGSGTAYDDPDASLKLKLSLRDSSAQNANIVAYDQFTWDMTGEKNAMGSQWVFVPVDTWPVDNSRINYYLTTEVINRCAVRYAAYNGQSNTWLYPSYWKFNLLRLHGTPYIRPSFQLAPDSHIAPGLATVYRRSYNVNETDKIPLRLFPVDDPSGIGVYNLVMNHSILYGTRLSDTYRLPASEGGFNMIEVTAYEPHPATMNFYDNVARITGSTKTVKAPTSSTGFSASSIARGTMPSTVLQHFTLNQNIPASLRTSSVEGILPLHITFNIPLTTIGAETWNTLLKELDQQDNSAYIGDVFADYFNLFLMAESSTGTGNIWNLTQELQNKGVYEQQVKVFLDTERGRVTSDSYRGVLTVSFIVMLMDGTRDGSRPELSIVPDVSNTVSAAYSPNADYIVIRDGKTDNKWNMTFFIAPRDYVVNPDTTKIPVSSDDVPAIADTGSSGGGGGCSAGWGLFAMAVMILRKLDRRF
ncbi:MAG: hypothetical protein IJS39_04130 [Synergistaceae bacterium]|nr:hypothetical protein [Synergistaceae bacterium]